MGPTDLLDAYLQDENPSLTFATQFHQQRHEGLARAAASQDHDLFVNLPAPDEGYAAAKGHHQPRAESAPAGRTHGRVQSPFAEIQNQPQYAATPTQHARIKPARSTPAGPPHMGVFRAMREAEARRMPEPHRPHVEGYTVAPDASNSEVRNIAAEAALHGRLQQMRTDMESRSYRQQLLQQLQQPQTLFSSSYDPQAAPAPRGGAAAPRPYTSPAAPGTGFPAAAAAAGARGAPGRTSLDDYLEQHAAANAYHAAADGTPTWLGPSSQPYATHHHSHYPLPQQQQQHEHSFALPTTLQQYLDTTKRRSSGERPAGPHFPHLRQLMDNAPLLPFHRPPAAAVSQGGLYSPFSDAAEQQQQPQQHLDGRFTSNSSTVAVMALRASLQELKQLRGRLQQTAAAAGRGSPSSAAARGHGPHHRAAAGVGQAGAPLRRPYTTASVLGRAGHIPSYQQPAAAAGWHVPLPTPWLLAGAANGAARGAFAAAPSSLWQPSQPAAGWDVWADTPWEQRMKQQLGQRQQQQHTGPARPHTAAAAVFGRPVGGAAAAATPAAARLGQQQRSRSVPRSAPANGVNTRAAAGSAWRFGSPGRSNPARTAGQPPPAAAGSSSWLQGSPVRRMAARSPGTAAAGGGFASGVSGGHGPSDAALAAAAAALGPGFQKGSRFSSSSSRRRGLQSTRAARSRARPSSSDDSSDSSSSGSSRGGSPAQRSRGLGRGLAAVDSVLEHARSSR